jgi:hypothetical protein
MAATAEHERRVIADVAKLFADSASALRRDRSAVGPREMAGTLYSTRAA